MLGGVDGGGAWGGCDDVTVAGHSTTRLGAANGSVQKMRDSRAECRVTSFGVTGGPRAHLTRLASRSLWCRNDFLDVVKK